MPEATSEERDRITVFGLTTDNTDFFKNATDLYQQNPRISVIRVLYMKFILGTKIENSQLFLEDGRVLPVTIIKAGPCQVTQVKKQEKDGYKAVQIGFGFKKKPLKPQVGHLKGLPNFRYLKEFDLDDNQEVKDQQTIGVNTFSVGDEVKVTGISKGKGFQGVVRRHGFHGQKATHGHKDQERMPGSIGSTGPQRVLKGTRMAGRMGGDRVTLANVEIVKIDEAENLLYVKGPVPGARNGLLMIYGTGDLKEASTSSSVSLIEHSAQPVMASVAEPEEKVAEPVEQVKEEIITEETPKE